MNVKACSFPIYISIYVLYSRKRMPNEKVNYLLILHSFGFGHAQMALINLGLVRSLTEHLWTYRTQITRFAFPQHPAIPKARSLASYRVLHANLWHAEHLFLHICDIIELLSSFTIRCHAHGSKPWQWTSPLVVRHFLLLQKVAISIISIRMATNPGIRRSQLVAIMG